LPVGCFVQTPGGLQIKFTSSVACTLHPAGHIPIRNKTFGLGQWANGRFDFTGSG
jgi:hypothetical protein